MAPDPRTFTLTEAAAATGLSRVTVRRWLDDGRFPSAFQRPPLGGAKGTWLIPASDLLAVGLQFEGRAARPSKSAPSNEGPCCRELAERVAVAEALAQERLRNITALERQLSETHALLAAAIAGPTGGGD